MINQTSQSDNRAVTQAIEIAIRLGVVFLITAWCLQILTPFISLIVWGAIIAVAINGPFLMLVNKLGGRRKMAATLISLGSIAIILIPIISLSGSLIESATTLGTQIDAGTLKIPTPGDKVRSLPIIGEKLYTLWSDASVNLLAFVQKRPELISNIGGKLLGLAAGVSGGVLQFVFSMLIAGAFLSSAGMTSDAMQRIASRLAGDRGKQLLSLSIATVRSVAVGVLGIAVIQGVLAGIGMMFADVPAAGLIAFFVLVLAIAQLPPLLVLAPVIFYVFSASSTTVAVIFLIWCILVSFSDMVLKPLLLGRGVDAPMLVILLGAIGGMISSGIVGLFVGAVVLTLGYKLVQAWLLMAEPASDQPVADEKTGV